MKNIGISPAVSLIIVRMNKFASFLGFLIFILGSNLIIKLLFTTFVTGLMLA